MKLFFISRHLSQSLECLPALYRTGIDALIRLPLFYFGESVLDQKAISKPLFIDSWERALLIALVYENFMDE